MAVAATQPVPELWCCAQCKWTGPADEAIDHALEQQHLDIRRTVVVAATEE